jgi:hypothetical protein
MPSISLNNIVFTGKMNVVPKIMGATFSVSQVDRQSRDATSELYGSSVVASTSTMFVGAAGVSSNVGAVHLYTARANTWDYVNDFALTSTELSGLGFSSPRFGWSIAMSGDWLIVGAPGTGGSAGAAFVYRRVAGVWQTTTFQKLTAADTALTGTNFGWSVAIDGTTLVVGHREGGTNGAAHVYVFNGTSWALQATIQPALPVRTSTQRIGTSVAISGNIVLAGGPATAAGTGTGMATFSTRTGNTWSAATNLTPTPAVANDGFGASVAIRGGRFFVGAAGTGSSANSVYVFNGATQLKQLNVGSTGTPTITDPAFTAASARVGWSVDANASGTVVFAGAFGVGAGATYVFEEVGGVWGASAINNGGVSKLLPSPSVANTRFGWSVNWVSDNSVIVSGSGNNSTVGGAVYTFK